MTFGPIFCGQPWSLALPGFQSVSGERTVSGEGSPRAFLPLGRTLNWVGAGGRPPRAGASFLWHGQVFTQWHIPAGHLATSRRDSLELHWHYVEDGLSGSLSQKDVLQRPESSDEDSDAVTQGRFIDWLIHSFQELGQDTLASEDAASGGLVRRDWKRAEAVWLNPDPSEPRIELIIRMAQDLRLIQTLESISRTPRRILVRFREQTPISRVKELDAACIRSYVRLPGRDSIEKAGSRQELLSVQRRASHDTLENRVTAWTLENLTARAEGWKRHHGARAKSGTRYRAVSALARHASFYRASELISEARSATLSHPVSANYPLMMEPRYKQVYRAYRQLLRYDKIKDDAWTWRRVLWSEAVTQLLSCTLRRRFREGYSSCPYYRVEPDRGRWLVAPASAGPFETSNGPLFVIDPQEADLRDDGCLASSIDGTDPVWRLIGVLGSDQILWWPDKKVFFPVWSILWTGDERGWQVQLRDAARAISSFSRQLRMGGSSFRVSRGLVIRSSLSLKQVDIDTATDAESTAVAIPLPMNLDTQDVGAYSEVVATLGEGLGLALDLPS